MTVGNGISTHRFKVRIEAIREGESLRDFSASDCGCLSLFLPVFCLPVFSFSMTLARACDHDRLSDAVVNGLAVGMDEVLGKTESGFQCRSGIAERAFNAVPERQPFMHQRQHTDTEKKLADGLAATQVRPQTEIQK
jgi:hypothetical protein